MGVWVGRLCVCIFAPVNNSMLYLFVHAYARLCGQCSVRVRVCIPLTCPRSSKWEEIVGIPVCWIEEDDNTASHHH